ncbi:hypothetical protein HP456_19315 [Bacillus haikouensis]|uniref:hypothetical protein n=1 Tax=Bacillus haikouensis TaxID=1510468 RepID=UPI001556611B|nr:hypothetical protein [Bacillus haikouensis]NQD68059.1 hypothetical protein [Bacillus haikouensis]
MNKQSTRAFSAGMLFIAVIIFIYCFYFDTSSSLSSVPIPDGHAVIKESVLKEKENEIAELKEQLNTIKTESGKDKSPSTSEKYQLTLTIESGMTPADIEEKLKQAKIISDDEQFVQHIVDNEYADNIQIGDFLVKSGMSLEEIAKLITK